MTHFSLALFIYSWRLERWWLGLLHTRCSAVGMRAGGRPRVMSSQVLAASLLVAGTRRGCLTRAKSGENGCRTHVGLLCLRHALVQ